MAAGGKKTKPSYTPTTSAGRLDADKTRKAANHLRPMFFSKWSRERIQQAIEEGRVANVFVENIPTGWAISDIYREMSKFGAAVDIFIPRKLSWNGIRYGFVRYETNRKAEDIVEKINKKGNGMLNAKVARNRLVVRRTIVSKQKLNERKISDLREGVSFSRAVGFTYPPINSNAVEGTYTNIVFIPKKECLDKLKKCAFGVLREGIAPGSIVGRLKSRAGLNVTVKTLGGEYVLVVFEFIDALKACVQGYVPWLGEYFLSFKEWEHQDLATHRPCWINIYGTPPHAWCEDFFRQITGRLVAEVQPPVSDREGFTKAGDQISTLAPMEDNLQLSGPIGIMDIIKKREKGKMIATDAPPKGVEG
ncbi:hypothetical protein Tsubulata_021757 [Turnera subulata]|uniref:RRM domain-containing protein n=1 Tax=Turnera subulata TaxID=218843 RepID=A0A9Q0J6N0_9ROSI|nr:hypothetical protein Tsubulata_021757 [Turnera subulata]